MSEVVPGQLTDDGVYAPKLRIASGFSFEGLVNKGAGTCGLESFNAYHRMEEGADRFFKRIVEPREFDTISDSREMQAFLKLRPLVEVAADYLTVLEVIYDNPGLVDAMLANPDNEKVFDPLIKKFYERQADSDEIRQRFDTEFYRERTRMQTDDYSSWLATQSPYTETVEEIRRLVRTQKLIDMEVQSGFIPWFATSKDEKSTFDLCVFYGRRGRLRPDEVGNSGQCMIQKRRIIGKEHTKDKVKQLIHIANEEGLPRSQVWRFNDRYDKSQQTALRDNGFAYQFVVEGGGYAFPHDLRKAKDDPMVIVIPRERFAKRLGQYAQDWGF